MGHVGVSDNFRALSRISILNHTLFAFGLLTVCVAVPERIAIPAEQASTAQIEHLNLARFWGDEVTPTLRSLIAQQYTQTRRRPPSAVNYVDFLAISGGGADGAFAAGSLTGWSERGIDRNSRS